MRKFGSNTFCNAFDSIFSYIFQLNLVRCDGCQIAKAKIPTKDDQKWARIHFKWFICERFNLNLPTQLKRTAFLCVFREIPIFVLMRIFKFINNFLVAVDKTRLLITFFECRRLSPNWFAGGVSFVRSVKLQVFVPGPYLTKWKTNQTTYFTLNKFSILFSTWKYLFGKISLIF